MCARAACVHTPVCVCGVLVGACRGQKMVSDPLEPEGQAAVSSLLWVLGTKPQEEQEPLTVEPPLYP